MYWLGLPFTLVSLYLINTRVKHQIIKWLLTFCLIMTMYSISYFYSMIPTSDSHYFRGLTESYINTSDPSSWKSISLYFEWPNYFSLAKITTAVSGLNVIQYEFILYTLIGFLLITALYCHYSKTQKKTAFIGVTCYFIINYYYLNFQSAPFSLALSLLLLLFFLEKNSPDSFEMFFVKILLFLGITGTHAFVPVFYIVFQFVLYVLHRNPKNLRFILLTIAIFSTWQIFLAPTSFTRNFQLLFSQSPEYIRTIEGTLETSLVPFDATAQTFSRIVTITTIIISVIGFLTLLVKKKVNLTDKALFISGLLYSILGVLVYLLGTRALSILTIPISLGITYWWSSKYKKYIKFLFFILLILFLFIPLHQSFYDRDILFQTQEAYHAENFFIDNYNGSDRSLILTNYRVYTYVSPKVSGAIFSYDPLEYENADFIIYTIGMGRYLNKQNYTMQNIMSSQKMNQIYSNGISSVALKSGT